MKKIKLIFNIILICIIVTSFGIIGIKFYKYYIDKNIYKEIKEYKPVISEVVEDEQLKDNNLIEFNEDYKFWINIPNTYIDYPVVQSEDNEFYLENNFYKEESISGTIFVDCNNDIEKDRNLILYGHNMKNGTMFAGINKFKEEDYFKDGIIKIVKDNKEYIYEVFSVFVVDGNNSGLEYKFNSHKEFKDYINNLKEKSFFYKESNNEYSNIITLFTCSYEFEEARSIICAGLVID